MLWSNAILSRYPITGKATKNDTGVTLDVDGRKVHVFNIHLDDSPYQPYQLLGIPYGDAPFLKTAEEAVAAAQKTREAGLKLLFADMDEAGDADADGGIDGAFDRGRNGWFEDRGGAPRDLEVEVG